MSKWIGLHGPITAADADAEPIGRQLFGPSYDARQRRLRSSLEGIERTKYQPWEKPKIERVK